MRLKWVTPLPTKSFIPKLKEEVSEYVLKLAEAVWQGAVDNSPVASGELRASWNLSLGVPNYETVGDSDSSPGFQGTPLPPPRMPKLEPAPVAQARYFVANGKKYSGFVEFGTTSMAPRLMLTRAIQSVDL